MLFEGWISGKTFQKKDLKESGSPCSLQGAVFSALAHFSLNRDGSTAIPRVIFSCFRPGPVKPVGYSARMVILVCFSVGLVLGGGFCRGCGVGCWSCSLWV